MELNFLQVILLTLLAGASIIDQMTFTLGLGAVNGIIQTGIISGLIVGNPLLGLSVGGILQSYALGIGMFGGASIPNWSAAAIIVTALAGSAGNMDTTIAMIGIPVAALTVQLDVFGRFANVVFQHRGDKYAKVGDGKQVVLSNRLGLSSWLISRMVPVFLALIAGPALVEAINNYMPQWLMDGFTIVSKIFPAVGFSILLRYLPTKESFHYVILGFALVAWFQAPIIAVSVIGLVLAMIAFKRDDSQVATETGVGEEDYDE